MARSSFALFYMKVCFVLKLLVKNQRMTLKEINEEWLGNLHGDGKKISCKCFGRYRDAIAEIFQVEILKTPVQGGYYYSMGNVDKLSNNEILKWSVNTFSTKDSFKVAKKNGHRRKLLYELLGMNLAI